MAFMAKRRIYESLPVSVKRVACLVPFAWLAGHAYRRTLRRAAFFERASACEIHAYREQQLGKVLRFAADRVPAYRALRGAVDRLTPFEALKAFPLLDKDTLQANVHRYLPRDFDRMRHYEVTTGGTSGNQLRLFVDDVSQSVETAFVHRHWSWVGYSPRRRKATFRGVPFRDLKPGVFWQFNPIYNELQFSPFHMSEKNLPAYVEQLIAYRPAYLHGYPSAIDCLAEYVLRNRLRPRLPTIRAAFLVSEGFDPWQRQRIEKAFRTRVFSFYGHSERVLWGGECEENATYHQFPDYGILEIIADNGSDCDREGERGELVGTGLLTRCLPLIRYRTGDYATRCASRCACGRNWDRFTDVQGRWHQEILLGKTGSPISIAALNVHGPMFDKVVRYQYYQDTPGVCVIRIMVAQGFTQHDRTAIEQAYRDKVHDELDLVVRIVDCIPLTKRAKLRRLDTRLKPVAGLPEVA